MSASTSRVDETKVAKMRADLLGVSKKYDVAVLAAYPHHFLDSGAKQFRLEETPGNIVKNTVSGTQQR